MFSGWAFDEMRRYITYKAKETGVLVMFVNPRYTAQRCSECLHIERGNRRSQSEFACRKCGHKEHADVNSAKVIKLLGLCQRPLGGEVAFMRPHLQATSF